MTAGIGGDARRGQGPAGLGPLEVRGADLSFTVQEEDAGTVVRDRSTGRIRPVERVLADAGATWVRLRVWVDPPAGYSDVQSALRLARRAEASGLRILLNLHYSDFWADPTSQETPARWLGQTLPQLTETVRRYTRDVVSSFAHQGTPVDMVQIGNEISNGLLWPTGRLISSSESGAWARVAALLNAGIEGARDGQLDGRLLNVMLHIDRGADITGASGFFESVTAAGVRDFEVIGLSYFPYWHGPLSALQANLQGLAGTFTDKALLIAETAYPWTADASGGVLHLTDTSELPDAEQFPPSAAGQAAFFAALREVCVGVPGGRGAGFLVWEPAWLPGVPVIPGADPQEVNGNLAMFDRDGVSLPSVDVAFATRRARRAQ